MICAIVHQLTRNLTPEEIERSGFGTYYVDHTLALWPQAASGMPWTATVFQSKGDPITDLHEDLAADKSAHNIRQHPPAYPATRTSLLQSVSSENVKLVHYQRFGESLRIVTDRLDSKNFYAFNPEFDNPACRS